MTPEAAAHPRYSVSDPDLSFAGQVDPVSENKINEIPEPGTSRQNGLIGSAVYIQKESNPFMQELGFGDYALVVTQDHIHQILGQQEDKTVPLSSP